MLKTKGEKRGRRKGNNEEKDRQWRKAVKRKRTRRGKWKEKSRQRERG